MSSALFGNETASSTGGCTDSRTVSNGTRKHGTARNGNGAVGNAAAPAVVPPLLPVDDAAGKQLNPNDFLRAYHAKIKEFDEEGSDVLFCKNIQINNPDEFVEYCPRGVVLVQNTSGPSLWDAWIRKVPNKGHELAVSELCRQMGNYAVAMNSKFAPALRAGGGHTKVAEFELNGDVLPEKRIDPDQALSVVFEGDIKARVVVEVELSNRNPLQLAKHVHRLMKSLDHLRCVIGLKIYKRSEVGGNFPCVCFVWKKRSNNTIYVDRVFDVGSKPSSIRSPEDVAKFWRREEVDFHAVSSDNGNSFHVAVLPSNLVYPLPLDCPDELENFFTISVNRADVYHGHTPTTRPRTKKPKRTEDRKAEANLEIDLFLVLEAIDSVKTKNFD